MRANAGNERIGHHGSRWRLAGWGGAAVLLALPLAAMRFTDEVNWTAADFAVFGVLLAAVGGGLELAVRRSGNRAYLAATGIALGTAFLLLWINGAVGLVGDESNPANRLFPGVVAVGLVGAVAVRCRPGGLSRVLVATALAQALVAVAVRIGGWGDASIATAFFVGAWLLSAWLFRRAARTGAASSGLSRPG